MNPLVNSLDPNCSLLGMPRSANRSYGLCENRPAWRNSGGQEDIYATDNSSSYDGFLGRTSATRTFSYRDCLPPSLYLTSAKLQLNMHSRWLS